MFEVRVYSTSAGSSPFVEWLDSLSDQRGIVRVKARVARARKGNLGDHRFVGDGVWEMRIAFGPGYRIYFGRWGHEIVLLLCGGDKTDQSRDIEHAKEYWAEFKKRQNAD